MPTYRYSCSGCGRDEEQVRLMAEREREDACPCGGMLQVRFTPTRYIYRPEHFKYSRHWSLPDKSDTAAWDARANPSQTHAPKQKTLKEHLTEEFLRHEKITVTNSTSKKSETAASG